MARLQLPAALVLFTAIAACQAPPVPPVTQTSASPAPQASPSAAAPSAAPSAAASQLPIANRVLLTGNVYDDNGAPVEGAKVEVTSTTHPEINRTVEAFGGSYGIADVPAGAIVRLRVSKEGYTTREQLVEAVAVTYGADTNPNIRDFGGAGNGMFFALSQFPEIVSVEPANKATGVASNPLVVKFTLSNPLPSPDRLKFESLLRIRIPGPTGEQVIRVGTSYRDRPATLTWDETGRVGTFTFEAPLVTYNASQAKVTVGFDQTAPVDTWPKDNRGRRLGIDRAPLTAEGTGADVQDQMAPFFRNEMPTLPSTRPDQLGLWGLAHYTNISFNLYGNEERPRVVSVRGIEGSSGANDRIVITFNKPMRGFPEAAAGVVNYHESVLRASNYRYLLGKTEKRDDRERFEQGDPKTEGTPADTPAFGSNSDTIVNLNLSPGALAGYTAVKVYVDEAVKDITGNPIQSSPQDPVTHLADHVLQGVVQ